MITTIDSRQMLVPIHGSNILTCEASDLGARADQPLPDVLRVDGVRYHYAHTRTDRGEIHAWEYAAPCGRILRIYND